MDNITDILKQEFQKLNDKVDNIYVELKSDINVIKQGQEEIKQEQKDLKQEIKQVETRLTIKIEKGFKETGAVLKTLNTKMDRQEAINISTAVKMREFEIRLEQVEAKVV